MALLDMGELLSSSQRIQPCVSLTTKNLPSAPHTCTIKEYPSEKTSSLGYAFSLFYPLVCHKSFAEQIISRGQNFCFLLFFFFFFSCLKAKKRSEKEKELVGFNGWVKYEPDQGV